MPDCITASLQSDGGNGAETAKRSARGCGAAECGRQPAWKIFVSRQPAGHFPAEKDRINKQTENRIDSSTVTARISELLPDENADRKKG